MKFLELLVVLNLCSLGTAFGHLNDSRADLIDSFGAPVLENANRAFGSCECVFQKGEMEVHAFLINGRCHMISYVKKGDGAAPVTTAVFKTGLWKTLEGCPLGFGGLDRATPASPRQINS